eukprot:TRINITY_DN6028_c0_g3_i1.p1 TRINITY_DN6028_c0_g3~~TRINITY_DN6028_c0_g3_i1.p1  ORF type:complete len:375 (-),score=58.48 TRINITY_DN6028_c0_g3_i1:424-1548(-)
MLEQSAVKDWKGKALLAAHLLVVVFAIVGICGVYGTGVHWSSATVSGINFEFMEEAASEAIDGRRHAGRTNHSHGNTPSQEDSQKIRVWFGLLKFGPDKDTLPEEPSDHDQVRRFVRRSLEHPSLRRSELATNLDEELAQNPPPDCILTESDECAYSDMGGWFHKVWSKAKAGIIANLTATPGGADMLPIYDRVFKPVDNMVTMCTKCDHYGKASLAFLVITLVVALAGIALLLVPEDKIPGRSELVYNISLGVLLVSCSLALLLWLGCSSSITTTTSSLQDVVKLVTEGLNAAGLQEMAAMYSSLTFSSSTSSGFYCTLVAMIAVLCAAALQLISVIRSSRLTGQYDSMGRDDDVEVNSSMVITGVAVKSGMA